MTLKSGLYVVATPIGNMKDITLRAIETLQQADLIICEDTRQTGKLCIAHNISTQKIAYHEHNASRSRPIILEKLQQGQSICLVSDAGTPLISDPGFKLVRDVREAKIAIFTVPGPNAAIAALAIAGVPTDRFCFCGFPPSKKSARKTFLQEFASVPASLVFYEGASRIAQTLADIAEIFSGREAVVARELTKLYEEVTLGNAKALATEFTANPRKGEFVILVHPPLVARASAGEIDDFLRTALETMSLKDAADATAAAFSIPRKSAYQAGLMIKGDMG